MLKGAEAEPISPVKSRNPGLMRVAGSPAMRSSSELQSVLSGHGSVTSESDIPKHFNLAVTYGKPV